MCSISHTGVQNGVTWGEWTLRQGCKHFLSFAHININSPSSIAHIKLGLSSMSAESICHLSMQINMMSTWFSVCRHDYIPTITVPTVHPSRSSLVLMLLNLAHAQCSHDVHYTLSMERCHGIVVRAPDLELWSSRFESSLGQFFSYNEVKFNFSWNMRF